MQKLASFSIETDSVVLLKFDDGTEQRVSRRKLSDFLVPSDIEKVRSAYRLRRNFLDTHMPHLEVYLLMGVTAALLLGFAGRPALQMVAQMIHHEPINPTVPTPSIIKSVPEATPTVPGIAVTTPVSPASPVVLPSFKAPSASRHQIARVQKPAPAKSFLRQVSDAIAPITAPVGNVLNALMPSTPAISEPSPVPSASPSPSVAPTTNPTPPPADNSDPLPLL